jgi:hypothetical protein
MLDREAVLRKEHSGSQAVMFSGKGMKSKKRSATEKNIGCYGSHKKGHKRSECPDKKKKDKENSGELAVTVATVASKNKLWMATDLSTCAGIMERSADDWYIDSACTQHVTGTKAYFVNYRDDRRTMSAFNGTEVVAEGLGDVQLVMKLPNGQESSVCVREVAYVPGAFNLLSQGTLFENGVNLKSVKGYGYEIHDENAELTAVAPCVGKLFPLDMVHPDHTPLIGEVLATTSTTESGGRSLELWHRRMAHLGMTGIRKLSGFVDGMPRLDNGSCTFTACLDSKFDHRPFTPSFSLRQHPLDLVDSNICEPIEVPSLGGADI